MTKTSCAIAYKYFAVAAAILWTVTAQAGPNYVFNLSSGAQPSNVGSITLTQVNSTTVSVLLNLFDTTLPAPQYGIINSGTHIPVTFNLAGAVAGVSISFLNPIGGAYAAGTFSLDLGGGIQPGMGFFNVGIISDAGNGSSDAYFADLSFTVSRVGGLDTNDFISNGFGFFSADLTDGRNTGAQAWNTRTELPSVPDGGTTVVLLGFAMIGLASLRAKLARK